MKKIIFFVIFFSLFWGCKKNSEQTKRNMILAKINNKIITLGDFEDYFNFRLKRYISGLPANKLKRIRYLFFMDMINEEVVLDIANKNKIDINDYQLEEEIKRIEKGYKDKKEFEEMLDKRKIPLDKFKKYLRREWLVRIVVGKEVYNNINVSNKEVLKYYSDHKDDYQQKEGIAVKELVFSARKDAESVLERLKNGEKFDDIYVSLTGKIDTDSTEIYSKDELPENFAKELFVLRRGAYSSILEDEYGKFHIFKVERKIYKRMIRFDNVKSSIYQIIMLKKRALRYQQWINSIKNKNYNIVINEDYFK